MFQSKDTGWLNGYEKRPLYMLSTRDPLQTYGHLQTESEGLEKEHANGHQKKVGEEMLLSDKMTLK